MSQIKDNQIDFFANNLVTVDDDPRSEWVDMPEFVQERQEAYKTITVRFETEDDYAKFAYLIEQKLTGKTKSIWYPFKPHRRGYRKVWV